MIKYNITNHCLKYDQVKPFDTTNALISGQWVNDTYYHRLAPKVLDHYRFTGNSIVVMVDPNIDFTTRAKMIYMQSDNFTYVNVNDVITNHTRFEYVNRYVDPTCETALVAPNLFIINDTIHYLESNCTITNYNDKVVKTMQDYYADPTKTQAWKNQQWYSKAKQSYTKNCITQKCAPLKDPNSKW